jgi:hypothetical protein
MDGAWMEHGVHIYIMAGVVRSIRIDELIESLHAPSTWALMLADIIL